MCCKGWCRCAIELVARILTAMVGITREPFSLSGLQVRAETRMSQHNANIPDDEPRSSPDTFSIQELVDASPATISLIDTHKWEIRFQNCSSRDMFGDVVGQSCHEKLVQS